MLQTPADFDGYQPSRDSTLYQLIDWASRNQRAVEALMSRQRGIEAAIDNRNC
jgi:hypothetical protein